MAMNSFVNISAEVVANWFSHPSGNPDWSGKLRVWMLMSWPNCRSLDGFLEEKGVVWGCNNGGLYSMSRKDSGYIYHGDQVASNYKWEEEHM